MRVMDRVRFAAGLLVYTTCLLGAPTSVRAQATQRLPFDVVNVPLVSWVSSRQHAAPETLLNFETDQIRMTSFSVFTNALATGNWQQARDLAVQLTYQVVALKEANKWFIIASDASTTGRDPTIVININARRDLILQAPHVPFEQGTAEQSVILLRDLGGRAAIISGAHRCASKTFTTCDGQTAVCGGTLQGYRDSDVGHNVNSLFHAAHVALASRWPNSIVVSLHGMREDNEGVRTSLIVSNGIRADDVERGTAATRFRVALGQSIRRPGTVVTCNLPSDAVHGFRKLCGYTNVQGRHINGDTDACRESVDRGTGRFIHVEQDWSVLGPYAQNWSRISQHLYNGAIVRALSVVVPPLRHGMTFRAAGVAMRRQWCEAL